MKRFLKKNGLYFFSLIILLAISIYGIFGYIRNDKLRIASEEEIAAKCQKIDFTLEENEKYKVLCDASNEHKNLKSDFYTMLTNSSIGGLGNYQLYLFLFISIPTLIFICKYLKSNILKMELQRKDYRSIIINFYKNSYKHITIIPIVIIFIFILTYIYNGSFEYIPKYVNSIWKESTMNNPYLFIILYILNTIFYSIFYVNLCLIVARKKHNFIIATILSYLLLFAIQIFFDVVLNALISNIIFKSDFGMIFTAMGALDYKDSFGIFYPPLFSFIIAAISSIVVYYMYREKEKLIIDCEENI